MNTQSRRSFLKTTAVVTSTLLFARAAQIQTFTPTGFPEPPDLPLTRLPDGTLRGEITAQVTRTPVDGQTVELYTYNGHFPGPTLRAREGDTLEIHFTNRLPEPTSLHWHGLHISPDIDNPLLEVKPGETHTYTFTVPRGSAGTLWYHPHIHKTVANQVHKGLGGLFIIEGPLDQTPGLKDIATHVLVLKDLHSQNGKVPQPNMLDLMNGMEGSTLLVNGRVNPTLTPTTSPVRLRVLNSSNARYYRLSIPGQVLHLIGTDLGLIEKPTPTTELLLAPGERSEILVAFSGPGTFQLQNLPYDRGLMTMNSMSSTPPDPKMDGMQGMDMKGMDMKDMDMKDMDMNGMEGMHHMGMGQGTKAAGPEVLMTFRVPEGLPEVALPVRLRPIRPLGVFQAFPDRLFELGEDMRTMQFLINGRSFDEDPLVVTVKKDQVEVWDVVNRSDMDHPFHLHTYPFQVVSRNGVKEPFLAFKDTVNVRPGERVRLRVKFADFTGLTVFHCHLLEHEDLGMMGVLKVE